MKTQLVHSYSSSSLSNLSRSQSQASFGNANGNGNNGNLQSSQQGLVQDHEEGGVGDCFRNWSRNTFRKKTLYRKLPICGWIGDYNVNKMIADIIAGLTVGLTILPQGLAYAQIAQIAPQIGLYSGFVGCFIYIFFGSTRAITIGPTASMAIITLSYSSGKPDEYVILLCFVTGLITLALGVLQLGFITNFLSTPMISGFTSAVAITIMSTQVKGLLGLSYKADGIIDVIKGTIEHIDEVQHWDCILSVICIIVLLFLQRLQLIFKFITHGEGVLDKILWFIATSRNAIVVVICTVVFSILGDPAKVKVIGEIKSGLPDFKVPDFKFNDTDGVEYSLGDIFKSDTSALIVLPILALLEHITIARALAGTNRIDSSQEMITIGLSNLIGAFFSSMPITGSFSRTSVNHSSGVQTPMGGLVTGVLVILALQFLTPYFEYIPSATLAAVIVCAVVFTIDIQIIKPMWRSKKADFLPWGITLLVSCLLGLQYGILCGFLISLIFLLYYSARPGIRISRGETSTGIEFVLAELDRSLIFPSVEYTNYVLMKSANVWARGRLPVVLDGHHIMFADYSAAQGVKDLFTMFNEKGHMLILWRLKPSVTRIVTAVMDNSGTPYRICANEKELEQILEEKREALQKDGDVKITFTLAPEDEEESDGEKQCHDQNFNNNEGAYQYKM